MFVQVPLPVLHVISVRILQCGILRQQTDIYNLDAACTCVSTVSGQCKQLALSLVSLVPVMNAALACNYTTDDVSTYIWEIQGSPIGNTCAEQVSLIDVAPALDSSVSPNRTQWAQAALLWDVIRSENLTGNANMRAFIQNANWRSLTPLDGPTTNSASEFTFHSTGYDFNFAEQTVKAPPASFVSAGQPSEAQIGRVNYVASAALDRMYTYAVGKFSLA